MAKKSILIVGDSFAAPWGDKYAGWPKFLENNFTVTNLAQAGVGEYKILKQLTSVVLEQFDCVIVCHTSPYRVHTPRHPTHLKGLHKNCDLIYTDIIEQKSWFNRSLETAKNWFKYHYDNDYQKDIYQLLRNEISSKINIPYISIDNLEGSVEFANEGNHLDFTKFWLENRGYVNHYSHEGNYGIYISVKKTIERILEK